MSYSNSSSSYSVVNVKMIHQLYRDFLFWSLLIGRISPELGGGLSQIHP